MSCNGLNSPVGSHQRCASAPNFASSAGSALSMVSITRTMADGWKETRCRWRKVDSTSPARVAAAAGGPARSGCARRARRCRRAWGGFCHNAPARDPGVADLIAAGDVNEVRHRVIAGRVRYRAQIDCDQIRLLAGFDRSDFTIESERARAVQRRHLKRLRGGDHACVAGYSLGEQCGDRASPNTSSRLLLAAPSVPSATFTPCRVISATGAIPLASFRLDTGQCTT